MSEYALYSIPRSPVGIRGSFWALTVAGALQVLAGVLSVWLGWGLVFAPLLGAIATAVFLWPRAAVYLLVTVAFLMISLPGLPGVYPADIIALVAIAGAVAGRLVRGEPPLASTPVNRALAAILIVFAISLFQAHNLRPAVVNWLRHLQLLWLLVTIVGCITGDDIRRLIRWLLVATALISVVNVVTFLTVGEGRRIFGPAGAFFPTFLIAGICQSAVGYLYSVRRASRLLYATLWILFVAALIATQTREVMLQMVLAMAALFYLTWRWSVKHRQAEFRRRAVVLVVALTLIGAVLVTGAVTVLESPSRRVVQAIEGRAPTIGYRLFLWKTGLKVFTDSPLLGIGLGQVQTWDQILPFWRLDPESVSTKGLGAHNDFITYLAETGIAGMASILVLFWLLFHIGRKMLARSRNAGEAKEVLIVWLPVCAIIMRFFFGTHAFYSLSGIMTAFYFGLFLKLVETRRADYAESLIGVSRT